jgi:cellulose synthase/poly-beta-1,6-N-acetylglucosamine synthase-like glycosyltransferase
MAKSMGCDVVALDLSIPFTAARARNEGFGRALQLDPDLKYVQFVDGDCQIVTNWLASAIAFLEEHSDVAAVCGRRRERYPEKSVFNQLCDIEWNSKIGNTRSCGGDVMVRAEALQSVNGYRGDLIAGEEPELCVRLRKQGWKIWRIDHEMTLHDAAMTRFSQWWNRSKRAGYAFAQGAALHGAPPERHCVKEVRRALAWGLFLPVFLMVVSLWQPILLAAFLTYPLQAIRISMTGELAGSIAWWRGSLLTLGKFPEAQGALKFYLDKVRRKSSTLIEYK